MLRLSAPILLVASLITIVTSPPAPAVDSASASSISVTGTGVGMYPEFGPDVRRYAVTTADATGGTLQVSVDAAAGAPVRIDGSSAPNGTATLTGLEPGQEISVLVGEGSTAAGYALVYLPPGFPTLERRPASAANTDDPTPGHVLLTLGKVGGTASFETAVDANGVPAWVRRENRSFDLARQPNGNYTVARDTLDATAGSDVIELDEQFRKVRVHRTSGLLNTDEHDTILLPDGTAWLMAYERDDATNLVDAVVQHLDSDGTTVLWQWNSKDHVDAAAETVVDLGSNRDYAHINSFQLVDGGTRLLMSFRHLSSVLLVAVTDHDGYASGEVIWRLGGRLSDFDFTDAAGSPDPRGGPCAQHTARMLADGSIMVFDNGAWNLAPLCVDPADPSGPTVARVPSRIAIWSVTPPTSPDTLGTAQLVDSYSVDERYAIFAGSAQELPSGRLMVGWASAVENAATEAIATELDRNGEVRWELTNPEPVHRHFSYRSTWAQVPDAIAPVASLGLPGAGSYTTGEVVVPATTCTDQGGSTLRSCEVSGLDTTTPGDRVATLTAIDGDGNRTTVTKPYTVVATTSTTPPTDDVGQPDVFVKIKGRQGIVGKKQYGAARRQTLRTTQRGARKVIAVVRIRNDGNVADRFRLRTKHRGNAFQVKAERLRRRTPVLEPGQQWTVRLVLRRRPRAEVGDVDKVWLKANSARDGSGRDAVRIRIRAR